MSAAAPTPDFESAADAARRLWEEGLSVIPLGAPGEKPPDYFVSRCATEAALERWPKTPRVRWAEFQKRQPSEEEIEGWMRKWPQANWAIITGRQLVIVDADTAEAVSWMSTSGVTHSPRRVTTAKGKHYYYQAPRAGDNVEIKTKGSQAMPFDFRATGGYVVAPGSVHATGVIYTEETTAGWGDTSWSDLPRLTPADLKLIQDFNTRHLGAREASGATPAGAEWVSPKTIAEISEAMGFIEPREYDDWIKVGQALHSLGIPEAFGMWDEWSQLCPDKYPGPDGIRAKWSSFHADGGITYRSIFQMAQERGWPNPLSGSSAAGGEQSTQSANEDTEAPQGEKLIIRSYRARDLGLDPRPTPPYLIDPILRQRENLLIAGPAKSQKTMWMEEAWLSLGLGRPLLGFEVLRPVRVYWVQAEMQWHQSRDRLLAHPWWAEELERDGAEQLNQNLVMTDKLETLLFTPHGVQIVIEDIRRQFPDGLEVFMLDSLSSVYDQESEDISAQMLKFLRQRIGKIREAFPGISVVLLHHTRKASIKELETAPFSAIRGSGALRGWYDSGIVMHRVSEDRSNRDRRVHFELRGALEPEPLTVRYDDGQLIRIDDDASPTSYAGKKTDLSWDQVTRLLHTEAERGDAWTLVRFAKHFGGMDGPLNISRDNLEAHLVRETNQVISMRVHEVENPLPGGNLGASKRPFLLAPVGHQFKVRNAGPRPLFHLVEDDPAGPRSWG